MFQKIKKIENISLSIVLINICLIIFYLVGLPQLVFFILLITTNLILVYFIFLKTVFVKNEINKSRNILPSSVIKAIEIDKYSMVMYDDVDYKIVWENEYFNEHFGSLIDKDIRRVFDGFFFKENMESEYLFYNDHYYRVIESKQSFILKDVSEYVRLLNKYDQEQNCILFIKIDNLDDISSAIDEVTYQKIIIKIRELISNYVLNYDCILRRYKNDSYIVIGKKVDFDNLIEEAQTLLDNARLTTEEIEERTTISIGAALNFYSLKDAETAAGNALNMALARGGDQIVVKKKDEDFIFYGGSSEAVEKRSKVKVRLMANSLESLIKESSNVVIMPHKTADLDAMGACLGLAKFVMINKKEAYICADYNKLEESTKSAYDSLNIKDFITLKTEDEVLEIADENTLIIVADTSNIEIFESIKVYEKIERRVIIDHHRRSKDFVKNPILVYIEPYASSTVELVCELLRFQTKNFKLSADVATYMLAGMMVDTAYFTIRTGIRTFEAATFLKEYNASPLLAKEVLQVSRDTYQKKLKITQNANYIGDIAISKYSDELVSKSLLAQSAIELLDLKGIVASFVIAYLEDGSVGVSARSNGDFNVQYIMEKIGGGGHFSMAGAQVNLDINEVEKKIVDFIQEGKN